MAFEATKVYPDSKDLMSLSYRWTPLAGLEKLFGILQEIPRNKAKLPIRYFL